MPACKSCQTPIDRMQAAASIFDMHSTFIMGRKAMSRAAKDRAALPKVPEGMVSTRPAEYSGAIE